MLPKAQTRLTLARSPSTDLQMIWEGLFITQSNLSLTFLMLHQWSSTLFCLVTQVPQYLGYRKTLPLTNNSEPRSEKHGHRLNLNVTGTSRTGQKCAISLHQQWTNFWQY